MTLLFDRSYPRSLDTLTRDLLARHAAGERFGPVEAWLFEDAPARRAAEARLAAAGIRARIRGALKPLVSWAMEELDREGLARLDIHYPRHAAAPERRFVLEAWPLAEILPGVEVRFHPGPALEFPTYRAAVTRRNGSTEDHEILAPNRVHPDTTGAEALSPTGWQRVTDPEGRRLEDRALNTEVETLFADGIAALVAHPWGNQTPHFERLSIRADLPAAETRLPHGSEVISLQEALHEDFYFATIELLQRRAGLAPGDRSHRPGQIAPDIRRAAEARLTITLEPQEGKDTPGPAQPLATAGRALTLAQVQTELAAISGVDFGATSRAGRPVSGRYRAGGDPAVILSAGQHANETSGVVGILRAARILDAAPDSHFALIPVKNPDGYALHRALTAENPFHMHHAARYTALGDDLMARSEPLFERAAMTEAQRLSGAQLHINLHGYPAHEWVRPWSGYLPRGFEAYAGPSGFRMVNGIPCLVTAEAPVTPDTAPLPAMTLITEFPDETIEGDDFRFAHDMQTEATLAAYAAFRGAGAGAGV